MQIHGFPAGRFIASRLLWASGASKFVTIKANGYKLKFHPSSVSAAMFCEPSFFRKEEDMLRSILRSGDTFVDVGANVGTLTLAAAKIVGPTGHVIAIEGHPKIASYLRQNVRLNGFRNVTPIRALAGEEIDGTKCISDRKSDDQNSVSDSGLPVAIYPLDQLIPEASPRLLKIDVEGFECYVLRGAAALLARTEYVYFESWEHHLQKYGFSTQHVFDLLRNAGFTIDKPEGYVSEQCENILAYRAMGTL